MSSDRRILDRQLGRNPQLLAEATAGLPTAAERFAYLRILVSLIETAHPEWSQAPTKPERIAELVVALSDGGLSAAEVVGVVQVRDEERGLGTA